MDFCGWSRLAEGEDKDQVFLISLAIGEMIYRPEQHFKEEGEAKEQDPFEYFSTWGQKLFLPWLFLWKAPAPVSWPDSGELALLPRSGTGEKGGGLGFLPEWYCHIVSHEIIFGCYNQHFKKIKWGGIE